MCYINEFLLRIFFKGAVAVFAIYVCKNDIIKQLEDTYPTLQRNLIKKCFLKCPLK